MTNYELALSELAVEDVNDIILWYKEQQPGLEYKFLEELRSNYRRVLTHPEMYGFYRVAISLRHIRMKRFPYYILYAIDGDIIRIAGIVHTARSPQFVRRRYQ